ncbi:MAG: class I SAM-dependent methyltransferase [Alphaproteobacteria bacterium]
MTPLAEKLARQIRATGPLTIADFMSACLGDPEHGYYMQRDAFGSAGDFVTAPEISQMFGELVGLWAVAAWELMGEPHRFAFVELGPGRGTLMADMIRTALVKPEFLRAAQFHLVEMSPRLRSVQRDALNTTGLPFHWHDRLDDIPADPMIVVANEFFDALPVRQFQRRDGAWAERVITLGDKEDFVLALAPVDEQPAGADMPDGTIVEASPLGSAVMRMIAERLKTDGGAALVIDYGSATPGTGSTLQAVRDHTYQDPLENPGQSDLTAHVDFAALMRVAEDAGAETRAIMHQGEFLIRMGLVERANALGRDKDTATRDRIATAMNRLAGPKTMGDLFKVLAIAPRGQHLPIFDAEARREGSSGETQSGEPKPDDDGAATATEPEQPIAAPDEDSAKAPEKTGQTAGPKKKRPRRRRVKPSPGHDKDRATKH